MTQWALVTGATAGIGESFTRLLASKGYNIALVARDEVRLHERAAGLREKYGIQTFVLPADLATKGGVKLVEKYIQSYEIEVLINNAGFGINKAFTASSLGDEQDLLNVLVRTPMRLMHVILPGMKERKSGTIINVSSVAGFIAGGTYSAAKSYLTVLSESLNTELKGTGVIVSALCPGFTRTEFHQRGRMKMKGLPSFMWLNADKLVAQSWKDARAHQPVSVPGWQYKLLVAIISIAPRSFVRQIGMNVRKKQR
ncbi:SDR family NAD(P)-dependent oxidoreductase [Candidatus Planktophila versatilis]|uniref:SDR family NAD(P)-dependent oxidoreductase n=1 Tax=Candidatus Planktophila versatilis TaxID=1884905 RepID=UPI000BAC702E|nr:SDR family oxidoreductase [Candidatus Planktophila versatilis]ASY25925.1 classical SDR family protein [Candidatus Planktophila versatilis]